MTASKEKLIKIYQEAKKRRIVLNQAEFAKAVGLSRVHLFKKMQEIPEKVIGKALQLLETNNDLGKTINVTQGLPELVGERIELTAAMRAAIKILTLKCIEQEVKISEIEAKLLKDKTFMQSFSAVSLELEKKMQDETEHILDEWRKK